MVKTIGEWIEYYQERYGRLYRIRIEKQNENLQVYYWWEKIPRDLLGMPAKRVWCREYVEQHGIRDRELEIIY